jgi:hypothetical protein
MCMHACMRVCIYVYEYVFTRVNFHERECVYQCVSH